ncbi:S-adenosyl-L-methionine-dependent methyltransferase [Amylostereum chailletii]|nr:S-adenosyl-L-methionine-dependent methyltransferase [Amylostereum chailletii]
MSEIQAGETAARYVLGNASEAERLDRLHACLTAYQGGRLTLAPLHEGNTQSILELGAGSGAWAIDAAKTFPRARIVAVDISPLPVNNLPTNVCFLCMDVKDAFPFDPESFDVVHARLLMLHIPNAADVLKRTIDLVKPGGWLILEDSDDELIDEHGVPRTALGRSTFIQCLHKIFRDQGSDPCIAPTHERALKASGAFSVVNARKVAMPITRVAEDPTVTALGKEWKETCVRVTKILASRYGDKGLTADVARDFLDILEDETEDIYVDFHFVWAQKNVD